MTQKVLISILGRRNWGSINAVWAMIRDFNFVPTKIYIMGLAGDMGQVEAIKGLMSSVVKQYGAIPEIIPMTLDSDASKITEAVKTVVNEESELGNVVALDLTAGKKQIAFSALSGGYKKAEHVFYLYIESLKRASQPYMLIPIQAQKLRDIKKEGA